MQSLRPPTWWDQNQNLCAPFEEFRFIPRWDIIRTHAHTHTQPFYGSVDFVRDNLGEPVPEETFAHSHSSWSSTVPNLFHPSNTIHGILPLQFTCLTVVFHNLSPSFLWSTSWPGTLHLISTKKQQKRTSKQRKQVWSLVEKDCKARGLNREDAMDVVDGESRYG